MRNIWAPALVRFGEVGSRSIVIRSLSALLSVAKYCIPLTLFVDITNLLQHPHHSQHTDPGASCFSWCDNADSKLDLGHATNHYWPQPHALSSGGYALLFRGVVGPWAVAIGWCRRASYLFFCSALAAQPVVPTYKTWIQLWTLPSSGTSWRTWALSRFPKCLHTPQAWRPSGHRAPHERPSSAHQAAAKSTGECSLSARHPHLPRSLGCRTRPWGTPWTLMTTMTRRRYS